MRQEMTGFWVVLDRVRHFQPIPIHRFLLSTDANMLQERTWRSVTDRSKAADAAAATNNSGGRRGLVAARRRMPVICRAQSNTATISKV